MGFDKDGHALKEEEGQWFWMPNKPNPKAQVARRVDPSFGGVAELFGDPNAAARPSAVKSEHKAAASFGGVVDMFGETEEDANEEEDAYNNRVQTKSRKRDPSFGGVADMFTDDAGSDEEPSSISDVGGNQKISNVGDFFNDTHSGPARTRVSKKRDPSFSGVADLFDDEGPDEDDDDLSPLNSGDEEFQAPKQRSGSDGGKRKRDPSFSGVADLFGDDSEGSESAGDDFVSAEPEGVGHRKAEASIGFGISEMSFSSKFVSDSQNDVKKSEPTVKPPPPPPSTQQSPDVNTDYNSQELKTLKKRLKDVEESKRNLVTVLSQEFDRLREIIKALSLRNPKASDASLFSSFFSTAA